MRKLFTTMMVVLLCVATNEVFTQTVVWSEDFSASTTLPTGWTTNDASGQGFVWEHSTGGPLFGTQPAFCATSAADGFILMNSDGGLTAPLAQNHDSRVTTSAIDCSSLATVVVRFENQYAYFSQTGSVAELGVSTDGTNFNYYPILTNVTANDLTGCVQIEEVDITADAAGQSAVYLQWRWSGNWEYVWRIDDISVQDGGTPIPPSSLRITNFAAISTAFATPINNADTVRFLADIENIGSADQTNVNLNVTVVNDGTNAVVYNQDLAYGTITVDSLAENQLFPISFVPDDSQTGSYTITYTLSSDSTDVDPTDNTATHTFFVTDSLFAKDDLITTQIAPADNNSYTYGTHYHVYDAIGANGGDLKLTSMQFGCANPTQMAGSSVDILLYEWDDLDGDLSIGALGSELTIASLTTYTFTGNETSNSYITVALEDFNNPSSLYSLKSNTDYIIVVQYSATDPNLDFFLSVCDNFDYAASDFAATLSGVARIAEVLDVGNTGDLNGGFVGNNMPALRFFAVENSVSTKDVRELPNSALKVFPSPATDFVNVNIELEEIAEDVMITMYSLTGQVLQTENLSNVKQDTVIFDVSKLAAGKYVINIATEDGVKAKFFTVVR